MFRSYSTWQHLKAINRDSSGKISGTRLLTTVKYIKYGEFWAQLSYNMIRTSKGNNVMWIHAANLNLVPFELQLSLNIYDSLISGMKEQCPHTKTKKKTSPKKQPQKISRGKTSRQAQTNSAYTWAQVSQWWA